MNRRQFLGAASATVATAGLNVTAEAAAEAPADSRPNILFMIADDMTFRTIGSISNPEVHTPNLDKLAARGCAFTHCFHQGSWMPAVCAPSRTMLNSGLTAFHARDAAQRLSSYQPNDVEDMQSKLLPVGDATTYELALGDYELWPQTFRAAGYHTYIAGKWHVDDVSLARCFAEQGPVGPGMYRSTGINGAAYQRPHADGTDPWSPTDPKWRGLWVDTHLIDNDNPGKTQHASELYADHVCGFLERQSKSSQPFLAYVGWNAPHDPRQAPQEFLDMYPVDKVAVPENFLPQHPFDLGDFYVRDEQLAPFPRTEHAVQVHRREYYAILSHMDAQIGRIFDALEKSGKLHNTIVVMTADHGLAVGEHGLMGKQNVYECSMRIPLIMAGPGIAKGKRVDDLVYQHSMFATTCELTGVKAPAQVEFPSLASLLHGGEMPVHDAIFGYYKSFVRSVRTKTHKLVVYPDLGKVQLFDMANDPWEKHDRSADPAMKTTRAELFAQLRKLQHELGDTLDLKVAA